MDGSERSLEIQVWDLGLRYSKKLESLGYSTFISTQPELAIGHIMRRISHPRLHNRMALTFKLRKEAFKKDYELFLRDTAKEAEAIDRHDAANRSTN